MENTIDSYLEEFENENPEYSSGNEYTSGNIEDHKSESEIRAALVRITALATHYCQDVERARESTVAEFIRRITNILPRIYVEFLDLEAEEAAPGMDYTYFPEYVDEDYYETIRHNIGTLLGANDTFLETFEEDMKYSDTPIAASISESLADIFQPLYNFLSIAKESDGMQTAEAYRECRENFDSYWSQTLCNVMRALNALRTERPEED